MRTEGRCPHVGHGRAYSWLRRVQKNFPGRRLRDTREQLRTAIVIWIEESDYRRRRQSLLAG